MPPPQDTESSGKSEGGEPSLGQGTGLGSLVRGREPVLRGGTPSPGKMRGRDRVLAPLGSYSWFWGEGVPPHVLLGYSHLCPAHLVLIGHGLGPALQSPPASQPSAPSDGFLHPCGQVQAPLRLSCHLCKMIDWGGGRLCVTLSSLVRGCGGWGGVCPSLAVGLREVIVLLRVSPVSDPW